MKRTSRRWIPLLSVALLLIFFQNCGPSFKTTELSSIAQDSSQLDDGSHQEPAGGGSVPTMPGTGGGTGTGGSGTGSGSGTSSSGDGSSGSGGTGSGSPTPPQLPKANIACAVPSQESVNTSTWPEIFVGTSAQNCSDSGTGTRAQPFCNPHLALSRVTSSGRIVSFLSGEYRLTNFTNASGQRTALNLPTANGTASQFTIVRAADGATPVILGSSRLAKSWQSYSTNPRIFRIDVSSYQREIFGLWQVVDGLSQTYTNAKRMRHMMVFNSSGVRAHAPVSSLSENGSGQPETSMTESAANRNFTWTKADANGAGCGESNSGCYIYLRADGSYMPNSFDFEIPQQATFTGGSSYMVMDGLHGRFSISNEIHFEGLQNVLIQNSSFGHLAAGDGNSYAIGLWFTNNSIVRNNKIFDSAYWGGEPNSKGLTFMVSGDRGPNWACNNEIYHIPGEAAIGSKGGVSNLHIIGNYIHDSTVCVQTDTNRTQDGRLYPGGGWITQQNVFERCHNGVQIGRGEQSVVLAEIVINNIFRDNFHAVGIAAASTRNSRIHNNIFIGGSLSNSCDSYGTCGAGIYFSNGTGTVTEYSYVFTQLNIRMTNNFFSNLTYSHGVNKNWTPNFSHYSFSQFRSAFSSYGAEANSLTGDPMLDAQDKPRTGSPVIDRGLGEFFDTNIVNMGIYLR